MKVLMQRNGPDLLEGKPERASRAGAGVRPTRLCNFLSLAAVPPFAEFRNEIPQRRNAIWG
jgi:hypothetical protein